MKDVSNEKHELVRSVRFTGKNARLVIRFKEENKGFPVSTMFQMLCDKHLEGFLSELEINKDFLKETTHHDSQNRSE